MIKSIFYISVENVLLLLFSKNTKIRISTNNSDVKP